MSRVLGRRNVEGVGFSYEVGLGTVAEEQRCLGGAGLYGPHTHHGLEELAFSLWKISVLGGRMGPPHLDPCHRAQNSFRSSVWELCSARRLCVRFLGVLSRPLFLSSARTTFSISSQAQAVAVIIVQFHLG